MTAGKFKAVPVNFIGPESKSRSKTFSSQSSINFYIDTQTQGRTPQALMPWPGEKVWSSGSTAVSRGMGCMGGVPYIVTDTSLYSIDADGVKTEIGEVLGSERCSFATDGTNLVIRTGSATYLYDSSTLSLVTDTDLENAQTVTFLNNQAIYQGTNKRFGVADAGVPNAIDGLSYASAEAYGDNLVQVYSFQEKVYMLGERSIEVWYNSGAGDPPFDSIQGSTSNVGTASPFSAANTTDFLYFVGADDVVYRVSGYQPQSVTPSSIAKVLRESITSDAEGYCFVVEGQWFYLINLPSSNITLLFSESTNEWTRLSSGTDYGRHLINGYCYAYGKHLVLDKDTDNVFEWDFDTYESNSETLIRERVSAPINAAQAGIGGERLLMDGIELIMETGVGNTDEPNPQIMVSFSYDGGRSFADETWVEIGREGESVQRVRVDNMASFYDLLIKVRVSDPNFISIHGASIRLKTAGR